jgi:hypothetical protein
LLSKLPINLQGGSGKLYRAPKVGKAGGFSWNLCASPFKEDLSIDITFSQIHPLKIVPVITDKVKDLLIRFFITRQENDFLYSEINTQYDQMLATER